MHACTQPKGIPIAFWNWYIWMDSILWVHNILGLSELVLKISTVRDMIFSSRACISSIYHVCVSGEHRERVFFNALVDFMTSGPLVALVLAKASAIASWRTLCGPTNSEKAREESPNRYWAYLLYDSPNSNRGNSIRALFGTDGRRNACHGSDSIRSAQRYSLRSGLTYYHPKC